jgi:hypothetical protein
MKRGIPIFLAIVLLHTSLATNVQASVSSGSPCKKAGLTSIAAGKTYICTKTGKKLIWKTTKQTASSSTKTKQPDSKKTYSTFDLSNPDCTNIGEISYSGGQQYECRQVADGKTIFIQVDDKMPTTSPVVPSEPLEFCQLPDQRIAVTENLAIAHPVTPQQGFAGIGSEKVVVVGIDFSDVPGTGSAKDMFQPEIEKASRWLKWYSNDKLKINFLTHDKWIRAPKPSPNYEAGDHGESLGGLTQDQVAADYLSAIEKVVDIRNTAAVWIVLPKNISTIKGQYVTRWANYKSSKYGSINSQIYAISSQTIQYQKIWSYFLHEHLHAEGLHGHFPQNPEMIGLMYWDEAPSRVLNSWDQITMNWLLPRQLYCADAKKLQSVDVNLIPMEREQLGIRSIMVKLSASRVLVVESHRKDFWSPGLHPGFAGIMAYIVDTTINPSYEPVPITTGMYVRFGFENHGLSQPVFREVSPTSRVALASWSLSDVMFQGESFTVEGIKISLLKSGSFDSVRLEKAS